MKGKNMQPDKFPFETMVQEIPIPNFGSGRLFAGTPLQSKPTTLSKEDWALGLLDAMRCLHREEGNKSVLAIPRSFSPLSVKELIDAAKLVDGEYVDLMDEWDGPHDFGFMTPVESMRQIIDHLQRGQDVIILSHSKKGSDFVHAILYIISQEHAEHPAKMWCGIAQDGGVELTQFQRGYLYGLMNATGSFGLEQLKNAFRERRVS